MVCKVHGTMRPLIGGRAALATVALLFGTIVVSTADQNEEGGGVAGAWCIDHNQCASASCRGGHCCAEAIDGEFARCADCNPAGGELDTPGGRCTFSSNFFFPLGKCVPHGFAWI